MRRFGVVTASFVLAAVGALGLTGCGLARGSAQDATGPTAAVEAEGQALTALGFHPVDMQPLGLQDPRTAPSATPGPAEQAKPGEQPRRRHPLRSLLRKNTLHGEIVVQTDAGIRTIAVQRGTVTAIDAGSMTVKSTDGFTMTWTFDADLRVIERRTTVQPADVEVGTEVGVAGAKDADRATARLIVIPRAR
ncbi:MAG TPA: hypothetical protein VF462_03985 [Micromonosporaceae bacterium]